MKKFINFILGNYRKPNIFKALNEVLVEISSGFKPEKAAIISIVVRSEQGSFRSKLQYCLRKSNDLVVKEFLIFADNFLAL